MRKDKARDIARSVLPSTARKSAREDKRNYKAKHRAQQRRVNDEILRSMNAVDDDGHLYTDPDLFDDFEEPLVYDGYHAQTKKPNIGWDDMGEIVQSRRDHDKLGPLLRWARATHDRMMAGPEWAVSDKVAYFRAVLPDTLQGRHALGHVIQALDLHEDEFYYSWLYRSRDNDATRQSFRTGLENILSTSKGRMAFHDFRLETVPVAAHVGETSNKVYTSVQAVDEEGNPLFIHENSEYGNLRTTTVEKIGRFARRRPYMVMTYVPQKVSKTCDMCAFLRNDPLFDADAVDKFVGYVWDGVTAGRCRFMSPTVKRSEHRYLIELREYVLDYPRNRK